MTSNSERLTLALDALTYEQGRSASNHLLGALSCLVEPEEFAAALARAVAFAERTSA